MKWALPFFLTLLTAIYVIPLTTHAQTPSADSPVVDSDQSDDNDSDDSAPVSRVARVSFTEGDVSFLRAGVSEWAPAVENLPLIAGDQLYTGRGARAEIQVSGGGFIRLLEDTIVTISELSDNTSQFEITQGTAVIDVHRLVSQSSRFEVDTPNSAVVLVQDGAYRLLVSGPDQSEISVRDGVAEVSTDDGQVRVRDGYKLLVNSGSSGQLQLVADNDGDWERWSYGDRQQIAQGSQSAPDYVQSYETTYNSFYGASDLSGYGAWTDTADYGYCWIPRVSSDWAPYRYGQWLWVPRIGWTWLAEERWGWAPYHYGRWAFVPGRGWAWVPGFRRNGWSSSSWDYRWRPALVSFFNYPTSHGQYVGWYPLSPRERWHRPDWDNHRRNNNPTVGAGRDWRRPGQDRNWINPPRTPRAITTVPIESFHRPTRSIGQTDAARTSNWNDRAIRRGLPDINPTPVAARPADDARSRRRTIVPPAELISRPVVTRHRPADVQVESNVHRERRFIAPTPTMIVADEGDRKARRRNRDETVTNNNNGGIEAGQNGSERRKNRIALPAPAEKHREGLATMPQPPSPGDSDGSRNGIREERRRAREQQNNAGNSGTGPRANDNGQTNETGNNGSGQREARREERQRAREQREVQTPNPNRDSSRVRDNNQHNEQQHNQARQDNAQQKQQHREERRAEREQRRKP